MTRSRQRRDRIASRIAESLDTPPASSGEGTAAGEPASAGAEPEAADRRRFGYQLPAWIALAGVVAIPAAILVYLLTR